MFEAIIEWPKNKEMSHRHFKYWIYKIWLIHREHVVIDHLNLANTSIVIVILGVYIIDWDDNQIGSYVNRYPFDFSLFLL